MLLHLLLIAAAQAQSVDTVAIDAREAERSLMHVTETLNVKPGPLDLVYPKFIPGEHSPSGTINQVFNFFVEADGKPLPWMRDPVDMFTLHLTIPSGTQTVTVKFDQSNAVGGGFGDSSSTRVTRLKWNRLVWYPMGPSDDVRFHASVRLPKGWSIATPLVEAGRDGDTVNYQPETLTKLVDSPAQISPFYRRYDVSGTDETKYFLEVMGDSQSAVDSASGKGVDDGFDLLKPLTRLHAEATAMIGARHYGSYRWLLTLSDEGAEEGLEHHECSEDGMGEHAVEDPAERYELADVLCHEYFHSFNGKFRRPAGLCTPEYQTPMKDELLWVYEGLTQFYGEVLAARSGFWTPQQYRERLANNWSSMADRKGRNWRPLVDTAVSAQLLYTSPDAWKSARRAADFYAEMTLVWLEVDQKIRDLTQDAKSLNDFTRIFHGGASNGVELKPYTFDDVVAALNQVAPYDWAGLFRERVYSVQPEPTMEGIKASGWQIVFNETPNLNMKANEDASKTVDLSDSIGVVVNKDGVVTDIVPGSAADGAGISPGVKLISINARRFDPDLLREAVGETKSGGKLELVIDSQQFQKSVLLDYSGGLRYPHLERIADRPDRLAEVLKPLAPPASN